jgi:hypothetical protein
MPNTGLYRRRLFTTPSLPQLILPHLGQFIFFIFGCKDKKNFYTKLTTPEIFILFPTLCVCKFSTVFCYFSLSLLSHNGNTSLCFSYFIRTAYTGIINYIRINKIGSGIISILCTIPRRICICLIYNISPPVIDKHRKAT